MSDITSDLELYYKLDETTGTTAADSSGNSRDGTLSGTGFSFDNHAVTGSIDGGLSRADNGDEIIGPVVGLADADQTISIRIKTTETSGNSYLVTTNNGVTPGGLSMFLYSPTQVRAIVGTASLAVRTFSGLNDGDWHSITLVLRQADSLVDYYFDGALDSSQATGSYTWNSTTATRIFERGGGDTAIDLSADEIRIYSRALDAEDAADLHAFTGILPVVSTCLEDLRAPLVRDVITPTKIFRFDDSVQDKWDAGITNAVRDLDHINTCNGQKEAVRITKNANGTVNVYQDFSPNIDLSGTAGALEFFLPAGNLSGPASSDIDDTRKFNSITMTVYDDSTNASKAIFEPNRDLMDGYKFCPIILRDFPAGVDLSSIRRILFQFSWVDDYNGAITLNQMRFAPEQDKARIFFRWDDGYDDALGYCNVAKANGFRCSLAIIPSNFGNTGILTEEEVKQLYLDGHAICNHINGIGGSDTGPLGGWRNTDETQTAYTSLANRISGGQDSEADLKAMGMGDHVRVWVVPGGYNNPGTTPDESDQQLITQGYCDILWYAGAGQPGIGGNSPKGVARGEHEWAMYGDREIDYDDAATVIGWIDDVIAKKVDVTFFGHNNLVDWPTVAAYVGTKIAAGELEAPTIAAVHKPPTTTTNARGSAMGIGGGALLGIG